MHARNILHLHSCAGTTGISAYVCVRGPFVDLYI
jgi:hypothetical protein